MDWRALYEAAKPPPNFPAEAAKPLPNFPAEAAKPVNVPAWLQEALKPVILAEGWPEAAQSRLSEPLQPAPRKWNVDADPNVPTEFKRKWRGVLQAKRKNSLEAIAIGQYLKLAEEHYHLGKGPVDGDKLWDRVCELYVKIHKSGRPTHRVRVLKNIGLGSLKGPPRGRPRKKLP